jgi:hypothetical protein
MDTGSVIALVVANLVTVVAILAGLWQHRKTLAQERELSDLGSVRGVLVEASLALGEGVRALDGVRANLVMHGSELFSHPLYRKPYEELEAMDRVTDQLLAELRVRLGPTHRAVLSFAISAATMQMTRVRFDNLEKKNADLTAESNYEEAGRQRLKTLKEIEEDRHTFDLNIEDFFSAAHIAAGAQLPA